MNEKRTPTLFTLRAMAAHLRVPQKWLREQAEAGKVPAVSTGSGYLFSLVPTVQAIEKLAEAAIYTAAELQSKRNKEIFDSMEHGNHA